jgi:hypothetical protein
LKIEPSADLRQMGLLFFQMKLSFEEAGFTSEQAYDLTKAALVAQLQANAKGGE